MSTIDISVTITELTQKVKQHLAVIGKRAKDVNGKPLYSDLTTSTAEDAKVWQDLFAAGADSVVAMLSKLSGSYTSNSSTITFKVISERWLDQADSDKHDLTVALTEAIKRFIWNYAISEFLAIIHPSTGEKYPPIFASTYQQSMVAATQTIMELAGIKRQPATSSQSYDDLKGEIVSD